MRPNEQDFPAAFVPPLLDPSRATPAIVAGPAGKRAEKRYNVYRNNVTVSLIEALAAIYPAVRRITGDEFFRAMARQHLRQTPPASPLLFEYGRDFPAFVDGYEHARGMPWLGDVARVERAWLDAYHASEAPALDPSALASVPGEMLGEVTFVSHPATRLVRSDWPAVTIFAMNRSEAEAAPIASPKPETALVTRPDAEVMVTGLAPGAAEFLARLRAGETLAAAVDAAVSAVPEFDLSSALAGMLSAGAFTRISFGDTP